MTTKVEFAPLHLHVNCFDEAVTAHYEVRLETDTIAPMSVGRGETALATPEIQAAVQALVAAVVKEMHTSVGLVVDDNDWLIDPEPGEDEDPL